MGSVMFGRKNKAFDVLYFMQSPVFCESVYKTKTIMTIHILKGFCGILSTVQDINTGMILYLLEVVHDVLRKGDRFIHVRRVRLEGGTKQTCRQSSGYITTLEASFIISSSGI